MSVITVLWVNQAENLIVGLHRHVTEGFVSLERVYLVVRAF